MYILYTLIFYPLLTTGLEDCKLHIELLKNTCLQRQRGEWIVFSELTRTCCRTLFIDECIGNSLENNLPQCLSESKSWLDKVARRSNDFMCKKFTIANCEKFFEKCNQAALHSINECKRTIIENDKTNLIHNENKDNADVDDEDNYDKTKERCCADWKIRECLRNTNLTDCFDKDQSVVDYFIQQSSNDKCNKEASFDSWCTSEDVVAASNDWLNILLIIAIIIIIIFFIIFVVCCIQKTS